MDSAADAKELLVELKLYILSMLTMKQAARTSLLSRSWKYAWNSYPVLSFQLDSSITKSIGIDYQQLFIQLRPCFTNWVNSVVDAHVRSPIDLMKLVLDLDVDTQSDIDNWLVFALSSQVKTLEFDFTPINSRRISLVDCYSWPIQTRLSHLDLQGNLGSLRSLCLKYVNVNSKDIECILLSCNVLEELRILHGCMDLTDIKHSHTSSLQLKHLEVSNCPRMMHIDILAPKLVSFIYNGHPLTTLQIQDASSLSKVSIGIGKWKFFGEVVKCAYRSLSKYFSQLEHLSWHFFLHNHLASSRDKVNSGINNPPVMKNLKHLVLHVQARCDESLLGWASLIEASPVLQRLTLEFSAHIGGSLERYIIKHNVIPLRSLKTLELINYNALPMELEFVTFVVENSPSLKEVFLPPCKREVLLRLPLTFYNQRSKILDEFERKMRSRGVIIVKFVH